MARRRIASASRAAGFDYHLTKPVSLTPCAGSSGLKRLTGVEPGVYRYELTVPAAAWMATGT